LKYEVYSDVMIGSAFHSLFPDKEYLQ